MPHLFAALASIAETRVRRVARRAGLRATLIVLSAVMALLAVGFGLAAATVALAQELGIVPALLVMAGLALVALLILLLVLAAESRRARQMAVRRHGLDREFARAALRSVVPPRGRPSRGAVGLILVAAGAFMVLRGRRDD